MDILGRQPTVLTKFLVVGLISSPAFQKCRFSVHQLHRSFPNKFATPQIRPMLNVAWIEYLTKMRRRHGKVFYLLQKPVAVFIDGKLLGDDVALTRYIAQSFILATSVNFTDMCNEELIKHFTQVAGQYKRTLVYFMVAIDKHIIGTMLFQLYDDLVPITCKNFMKRCKEDSGYRGTPIHRIVKNSWIQCGGWSLKPRKIQCENYAVPHDRRGVLAMCNERRHEDNSTQFFIALEATPWMDYKYVAFGQLVQGEEILSLIEKVPTYYEAPLKHIEIVNCGEFTLCPKLEDQQEYEKSLNPVDLRLFQLDHGEFKDDLLDADSVLSVSQFNKGKYYLRSDLRPYYPFTRFSRMFEEYFKEIELATYVYGEIEEEGSSEGTKEVGEEVEDIDDEELNKLELEKSRQFLLSKYKIVISGDHLII